MTSIELGTPVFAVITIGDGHEKVLAAVQGYVTGRHTGYRDVYNKLLRFDTYDIVAGDSKIVYKNIPAELIGTSLDNLRERFQNLLP